MDTTQLNTVGGVGAALLCGFGVRYLGPILEVGGAAGAAVVVGACFIMMIDALSDR